MMLLMAMIALVCHSVKQSKVNTWLRRVFHGEDYILFPKGVITIPVMCLLLGSLKLKLQMKSRLAHDAMGQ